MCFLFRVRHFLWNMCLVVHCSFFFARFCDKQRITNLWGSLSTWLIEVVRKTSFKKGGTLVFSSASKTYCSSLITHFHVPHRSTCLQTNTFSNKICKSSPLHIFVTSVCIYQTLAYVDQILSRSPLHTMQKHFL